MKKLIMLVLVIGIMFGLDVQPEFRGNKFGTSLDKLNETVDVYHVAYLDNQEIYFYIVDYKGNDVYASYAFYKGKLYSGAYLAYEDVSTEMANALVESYSLVKESEGVYVAYSKDKKTKLVASDEVNDEGDSYICIRVIDVATNKLILEEEKKARELKL